MEVGKKALCMIALSVILSFSALPAVQSVEYYDLIVVRGDIPTDYVVASIYAGAKKIPLVLVNPDYVRNEVREGMRGLLANGHERLLIIGGKEAITEGVEDELKSMGFRVSRLWDWSRYGTAARVSIDLWGESETVVITNGEDYSFYLTAQKIALEKSVPMLFVKNGTVPEETADALKKLNAKNALMVGCPEEARTAIISLGLSVQDAGASASAETGYDAPEREVIQDFSLYVILSVTIAAVIVLGLRMKKKAGVPVVLTQDEERLVDIVRANGKIEQTRLAGLSGFSKPRISRMLRSLEERRVIVREKRKKAFIIKISS